LILFTGSLFSCHSAYTPKPRGYFRISFPQKSYRLFDEPGYPYTFEYPVYARIVKDTSFFNARPENPWWINIEFPQFNGKIYISYKIIGQKYALNKLVNDAYTMTYKNTVKADAIVPVEFSTPNHVSGIFYNVSGNAATARQFFATDSTRHFLRGALYFYAVPNADSLKPVIQFVEKDMWHLLRTLKWR
jgi:gliding motility-associated lipoprotein GldD